jgi:DNA integrity scanning protein DisA with diadenylate cyclase activity
MRGAMSESAKIQSIFFILDGLCDGLSHFLAHPTRAALLFAEKPGDPIRVYDPKGLLEGHEPVLKKLYLSSDDWRRNLPDLEGICPLGHIYPEKNLQLAGLISFGGRSRPIFYQMWFTEHHPDMCSIGPTERWLEHAVCQLANDFENSDSPYWRSRYMLSEYATHAVRDHVRDELNLMFGWDTRLEVYTVLDAVLGISKTREEGAWPRGTLVFIEPGAVSQLEHLVRFPRPDKLRLANFKHVRKLILAVEGSDRSLVSDGQNIIGVAFGRMPELRITADFRGSHGFLRLSGNLVCSFSDGSFHSSTRKPNLVQLEEALLEADLEPSRRDILFQIVSSIVLEAGVRKYGCSIVIDLNEKPVEISGQPLDQPINLEYLWMLELAKSLSKVDGALHIRDDLHLHGFACLLDGRAIPGEDRARGARFNSALRFTAERKNIIVVVVSSDRPVSVIRDGVELSAMPDWGPLTQLTALPPTLEEWLENA